MAETLLSPLIEKLVELLFEEAQSLKGVRGKVKSLKDELEIIQSYLKDADARLAGGDANETIKTWTKQVRVVAERIEDAIDDLASEIENIKESLGKMTSRAQTFGLNPLMQGPSNKTVNVIPRISSLSTEKDELVGIEPISKELTKRLVEGPTTCLMVAIVGEGGIGKTTLAETVYEDEVVKGHFDCRAWITVSQSYDAEKILKTMKNHIWPTQEQPLGEIDVIRDLTRLLKQYLQTRRYVIVFDDIWDIGFWEVIKHALPINDKGRRIIITTRKATIASSLKRTPYDLVQELNPWPPEQAWELFCKRAFQFAPERRCPQDLVELSRKIISKCQGLPLVISTVASLLSTKEIIVDEWKIVLDKLTNVEIGATPELASITKILSLSYHDLQYHLKPCYLYFGIFPEDFSISDGDLYKLWIAEGFIETKREKPLEKVAEEYLNELIHRNLVSFQVKYGVDRMCRVHNLMREIILIVANEVCFSQILFKNKSSHGEKSRRISIYDTTENALRTMGDSRIRSVFLFDTNEVTNSFIVGLFENFKLLKVLDFSYAPLYSLPNEVGNLFHLKYLCLRSTKVKVLPKSIGKLRNLQTLDLTDTLVRKLPIEIKKLKNLRHLSAYFFNEEIEYSLDSYCGVRVEEGIGRLEELQTLSRVEADSSGIGFLNELRSLRKLKCLDISKVTAEMEKVLGASIEQMKCLEELFLISTNEDEVLDLNCISSPPPLRFLKLNCRLKALPVWISELHHLQGLELNFSRLNGEPLKYIKHLPNLAFLRLFKAYVGAELHFEEGGFRKLKQLQLKKLEGLKVVKIDESALSLLKELKFGPFPLMKEMPSDIQRLRNLKSLEIWDMTSEFVVGLQPNRGPHYSTIRHVPSVTFWYKHPGMNSYEGYKLASSSLLQTVEESGSLA
ncbi:hypothetical protein TIFTF001_021216 [Ficus carica]|uniref:NB-ARC domain, LRR domain containing protein n=1 Tax=Ficus carica TaxID=3494 RepID=A0AA88AH36_FICCA|nr:hypothetical protein TIFTF001_021216 [Ficus carica]